MSTQKVQFAVVKKQIKGQRRFDLFSFREKNPKMMAAEERRLEVYNIYQARCRKPANSLATKVLAAGLVISETKQVVITEGKPSMDAARKVGNAPVDLNNFEEQLFLTCE